MITRQQFYHCARLFKSDVIFCEGKVCKSIEWHACFSSVKVMLFFVINSGNCVKFWLLQAVKTCFRSLLYQANWKLASKIIFILLISRLSN
jgi:hypothetical protein